MAKASRYRNHGRVFSTPLRPYEKERFEHELKVAGEYGLRNKREIWRANYMLTKIRNAARTLLTLEETNPQRQFDGAAIIRRLHRYGILSKSDQTLDSVLSLTNANFLERRLQTLVYKKNLAKSIHHARCLITQGHIAVGDQVVTQPNFLVRVDSERHIRFADNSPFGTSGKKGRVAKKRHSSDDE